MFDPTHALRFDLLNGSVRVRSGERVLMLPALALDEAIEAGGGAVATALGRALGASCGRAVLARFGSANAVRDAGLEEVLSELHGMFAIAGLGALSLERWGRALVLVVEHTPIARTALLEGLVVSALRECTSREDVGCVAFPPGEDTATRLLVASSATADRVRQWLANGDRWGDVLIRLQPVVAK